MGEPWENVDEPVPLSFPAKKRMKALQKHPVFADECDFKTKYGLDISDEMVVQLKTIFAVGNVDESGIIGRRQFTDLMSLIGMDPEEEELEAMLVAMDENGDGQIEFEEFAVAMCNTYDADLISEVADVPVGSMGTRAWARGEILWSCNSNLIVCCTGIFTAVLVYFQFILVPLTLAYFMTFLLVPLMNVFEQRPLLVRGKSCCEPKKDEEGNVSAAAGLAVGKMPHGIAVIGTLAVFFGVLISLVYIVGTEMTAFLDDPIIQDNLDQLQQDYDDWLNNSGVLLISAPICEHHSLRNDGYGIGQGYILNDQVVWAGSCPISHKCTPEEAAQDNLDGTKWCENVAGPAGEVGMTSDEMGGGATMTDYNLCKGLKGIDCAHDGYTAEDIGGFAGLFGGFFNMFAMVMLFVIYLMMEKNPDEAMFKGDNQCMGEIEGMIDHYISLKTMLSFVTGIIVAIMLMALSIKLAVLFGICSFVLNYIPNVGSIIAMFLPLPVVLLDPALEGWQKAGAFIGPGLVQGYVGNVLEPSVFGASLNMTPLSILSALVMWGSVWGLPGAVLSVPMLGIQKISMNYTNHPFAKYCLMLIREDPTLDEADARDESMAGALGGGASDGASGGEDAPAEKSDDGDDSAE